MCGISKEGGAFRSRLRSSFPPAGESTTAARTRPGLRPSLGSGQPAPPWAGLLLDGTCPQSSREPP
jgi:hypothetical protein